MKCEKCNTESLIQQDQKDPVTQRRSNYWWCTQCSTRSKPAPVWPKTSELAFDDDETEWCGMLPGGLRDD